MNRNMLVIVALTLLAALATGVALATPPFGLTSQLLVRGGATELRIQDQEQRLKLQAKEPTDLAIVKATLAAPVPATPTTPAVPGGSTGWHGHPGPSLVVVLSGTLTMYEPEGKKCIAQTFGRGQAFAHPADVHNFVNTGTDAVEFYVVYFVPAGAAPLLRDEVAQPQCP